MERLSTLGVITHLIRNGAIKLIGITNPTIHRKILQKKTNIDKYMCLKHTGNIKVNIVYSIDKY